MGSLESQVPVADIYEGLGQCRLSCLRTPEFHTVFCGWYIKYWPLKTLSHFRVRRTVDVAYASGLDITLGGKTATL